MLKIMSNSINFILNHENQIYNEKVSSHYLSKRYLFYVCKKDEDDYPNVNLNDTFFITLSKNSKIYDLYLEISLHLETDYQFDISYYNLEQKKCVVNLSLDSSLDQLLELNLSCVKKYATRNIYLLSIKKKDNTFLSNDKLMEYFMFNLPNFIPSSVWLGRKRFYVFKTGVNGLGYYRDPLTIFSNINI